MWFQKISIPLYHGGHWKFRQGRGRGSKAKEIPEANKCEECDVNARCCVENWPLLLVTSLHGVTLWTTKALVTSLVCFHIGLQSCRAAVDFFHEY